MEIRHYAKTELNFDPEGLPFSWPSPPVQHAVNYNTGSSLEHHPCTDYLTIDWYWPGLTPWTSSAATSLARKFCMEHEQGGFPAVRRRLKEDRVNAMFVKYILLMKRRYIRELEEFDPLDYFQRLVEEFTTYEWDCDCNEDEEESKAKEKENVAEDRSESEEGLEDEENEDF
jgi:hypothetical protein